ncbi:MAG: hypothetical protein MUF56_05100 [Solirubrobacteraceae bacterium]|nr:hypothetical protein [Solirubrobacteraceae bacterium]
MIPLRDDTERERAPAVAGVLAAAAGLAALVVLVTGAGGWTALLLALNAGALWVFGAGVEGAVGRGWLIVGAVFGGLGAAGLALVAGADETTAALGAAAATGAAFETVATHLLRLPGARITSLLLVPFFAGLREVPAAAWGAIWAGLAIALIVLGALGG